MQKTHNKRGKIREILEATVEEREEKQKPLTAPSQLSSAVERMRRIRRRGRRWWGEMGMSDIAH